MTSNHFFDRRVVRAVAAILLASCAEKAPQPTVTTVASPVETIRSMSMPEMKVTPGTVRSTTVSPIAARVMGTVTRVLVSEGQHVHAGELLVEIDSREAQARSVQASAGSGEVDAAIAGSNAAVSAAEANATLAAATWKRYAALRERGSVSAQEFEEVAARKAGADAHLDQARRGREALLAQRLRAHGAVSEAATALSYSQIRSPISGVVTARTVDPGAQAAPGMPLMTVEDDSHYRVETMVDEAFALRVRPGDAIAIDAGGTAPIQSRVRNVVPALDPATRSALVKIDLPPGSGLRSGAFVRARFMMGTRTGTTVPSAAIARNGQLTSVFVVDHDGIARMRLITLGEPQGERVEVLSGIDPGETIVPRLRQDIHDGVRIQSGGPA